MIIYKKKEDDNMYRLGVKETVATRTTVFFFGVPIYSYRYKEKLLERKFT